ncbi:MAG TPA: EAL domain-containing protein, partial [Xanthobacteraceae bacterium]
WVMRAACRQMKRLLAQGLRLETMAVNLSPRHFQQADIHERVRAILADTGLPACRLELEITESALMKQRDGAVEKLSALKALGVRIAIDDFGTGYSSLAYLKRFPIDKLKIDQGFVSEIPGDHASKQITSAIIALGKTLHLELVAEGVETQAQFEFLKRLGCDTAQGYLFSRPLPENDVAAFVRMFSSTPLTFRRPAASGGRHRAG